MRERERERESYGDKSGVFLYVGGMYGMHGVASQTRTDQLRAKG
jgi:hypothetical protein